MSGQLDRAMPEFLAPDKPRMPSFSITVIEASKARNFLQQGRIVIDHNDDLDWHMRLLL